MTAVGAQVSRETVARQLAGVVYSDSYWVLEEDIDEPGDVLKVERPTPENGVLVLPVKAQERVDKLYDMKLTMEEAGDLQVILNRSDDPSRKGLFKRLDAALEGSENDWRRWRAQKMTDGYDRILISIRGNDRRTVTYDIDPQDAELSLRREMTYVYDNPDQPEMPTDLVPSPDSYLHIKAKILGRQEG